MARGSAGGILTVGLLGIGGYWLYKKGFFGTGAAGAQPTTAAQSTLGKLLKSIQDSVKQAAAGASSKGAAGGGAPGGTASATKPSSNSNTGSTLGNFVDLSSVAKIPDTLQPPPGFAAVQPPDFGGTFNPGGGAQDMAPTLSDLFAGIDSTPLPVSGSFMDYLDSVTTGASGGTIDSGGGVPAPDVAAPDESTYEY